MKCELVVYVDEVRQKVPQKEITDGEKIVAVALFPSEFQIKFPVRNQVFTIPVSQEFAKRIYESETQSAIKITVETVDSAP